MEILLDTWVHWQGKVLQGRKLSRVNKSGVRYGPCVKNSTSQCFCSSALNHLRMFQPLPGGCSRRIEEEDTSLTKVHTCAVTQACSQLRDMRQVRIVSLQSLCLLCFFSDESYFQFDCLTARLVPHRARAWFALQLGRSRYLGLSLGVLPIASPVLQLTRGETAQEAGPVENYLKQHKTVFCRLNILIAFWRSEEGLKGSGPPPWPLDCVGCNVRPLPEALCLDRGSAGGTTLPKVPSVGFL